MGLVANNGHWIDDLGLIRFEKKAAVLSQETHILYGKLENLRWRQRSWNRDSQTDFGQRSKLLNDLFL